jgi:DNA invertase Pin-like site-specific DNA recombinase
MFQMMGVFAEFERAMIRERVLAGLKPARSHPKLPGIGWCPGRIRCDNQR